MSSFCPKAINAQPHSGVSIDAHRHWPGPVEFSEIAPQPPPRLLSWTGPVVVCGLGILRRRAGSSATRAAPTNSIFPDFDKFRSSARRKRRRYWHRCLLARSSKHGSGNLSPPAPRGQAQRIGPLGNLSRQNFPPDVPLLVRGVACQSLRLVFSPCLSSFLPSCTNVTSSDRPHLPASRAVCVLGRGATAQEFQVRPRHCRFGQRAEITRRAQLATGDAGGQCGRRKHAHC